MAQQTEPRIAFVVGNANYGPGALPNALNDAGLVAEALRSIGFEIVEGADLSQADLIRTYREFLAKVTAGGPDTLAFVYFAGHALSFDGENVLLGVDARLARDSDIALESVRLSDLLRPLGNSPARAKVMMIDAARPLPFQPQGRALARGLEADRPAAGHAGRVLVRARHGRAGSAGRLRRLCHRDCRNAARAGHRSRYRVHPHPQPHPFDVRRDSRRRGTFPRSARRSSSCRRKPRPPARRRRLRSARLGRCASIGPDEAYALAIEMDTLDGYVGFVRAYPGHPLYAAGLGDDPRAARGARLDARSGKQYAAGLLDLHATLSERHVCARMPNSACAG